MVILKSEIAQRNLYVHGRVLNGAECPVYLTQISVVHAIRTLRDWIHDNRSGLYNITTAVIYAGDTQVNAGISE